MHEDPPTAPRVLSITGIVSEVGVGVCANMTTDELAALTAADSRVASTTRNTARYGTD